MRFKNLLKVLSVVVLTFSIIMTGCTSAGSDNENETVVDTEENKDGNQGGEQGDIQDENQNQNQDDNSGEAGGIEIEDEGNNEDSRPKYYPAEYSFSDEEINQIGTENRNAILSNPNTMVDISLSVSGLAIEGFLDFDGDGIAEKLQLTHYLDGEHVPYQEEDKYLYGMYLWADYSGIQLIPTHERKMWGYSPDGESIFFVLYDPGLSDDRTTTLYTYQKRGTTGQLVECFSFWEDMRNCELKDGTIYATIGVHVVENDMVDVAFKYLGANSFANLEQILESKLEHEIELLIELQLKPELDSEETITVAPQMVEIKAYDSELKWVLIEAEDGTTGWFEVDMGVVTQNGKYTWDIFDGLWNAG